MASSYQAPIKPSWRGLKTSGGGGLPLVEFAGLAKTWTVAPDNFSNMALTIMLDQLQVHESDTPYPYPECALTIKLSEHANSGWGKFGESVAKALGVDINEIDIDRLMNQTLHIQRHDVHYGNDKQGNPIAGKAWELIAILPPGQAPTWILAGNPGGAAALTAATSAAPATPVVTGVDPVERAYELLHGKGLLDFHQAAFADATIKNDPVLTNAILSADFIKEGIAAGKIQEVGVAPNVIYSVVGK